jgi:hypothetical protein
MQRHTQKHSAFFALIETNIVKPKVIKDMGWLNGCWQEIAVTRNTPVVTSVTARQPFGVSMEQAFNQVKVKP